MDSKIGLKITHIVINSHSGSPHQSVHFDQIQGIFQDFAQEWVNFKGGGGANTNPREGNPILNKRESQFPRGGESTP